VSVASVSAIPARSRWICSQVFASSIAATSPRLGRPRGPPLVMTTNDHPEIDR
jgi:hypothetical protein